MSRPVGMDRRTLVKRIAVFAATATALGKRQSGLAFGELTPKAAAQAAGILRISLADYPALQSDFGSVRIGTSAVGKDNYPLGVFAPVLINRAPGPVYYAMNAACTHEGCIVPPLDKSSQLIQCRCHGSRYDITGEVVGGPAGFSLLPYPTSVREGDLVIEMEDLIFDVAVRRPSSATVLELEFLAFKNIVYEVRFRPSLQAAAYPVPFSASLGGVEGLVELAGVDDFVKVYLAPKGASGFYEVAMKARPV